ncbi:probable NADH dehydrogenase 1 alpha subcomplex subunit 12 [Caerostris extrusa]|uniref:NADH dehydrogenase [ubiquinone] 1 alpha subcomplex subunit 12 n=1 Tax=Caerostris extrusa TaxID=172846 RepID=A0AAV4QAX6_CAEEX|nr:probable NADH dehydrogenase 1 alpha subcomplex subunit 12 [Caerostris extrusa]
MAKYLGLDKIRRVFEIVKHNGGVLKSLQTIYRTDELKMGILVGTDKFGNKYYENKMHFYSRNRWVDYTEAVNLDYDGSQVPPEWHRWLHHMTDDPPTIKKPVDHKWIMDHTPNMSGTDKAYMPYSTTKPKIQAWVPPK